MKKIKAQLRKTLFLGGGGCALIMLLLFSGSEHLVINRTHSLPGFLYLRDPEITEIERGDIVQVCPLKHITAVERALHITLAKHGMCTDGTEPLLKIAAAVPGDFIQADGSSDIKINGRIFAGSKPRTDSILPKFRFTGKLPAEHYLLLTPYYSGFDSRYFGWCLRAQIMAKLTLLF